MLIMSVAASIGVWLFYVQHQFEGVYWERHEHWEYTSGAFEYRRASKEKRWDKMSKVFPKLARSITMAAKSGGPDPETNSAHVVNDALTLEGLRIIASLNPSHES